MAGGDRCRELLWAEPHTEHFASSSSWNLQHSSKGVCPYPILQISKLRLREMKQLAQSHGGPPFQHRPNQLCDLCFQEQRLTPGLSRGHTGGSTFWQSRALPAWCAWHLQGRTPAVFFLWAGLGPPQPLQLDRTQPRCSLRKNNTGSRVAPWGRKHKVKGAAAVLRVGE